MHWQVPHFTFVFFLNWNFTKWIRQLESSPQSKLIPIIFGSFDRKYKMMLGLRINECYEVGFFELSKLFDVTCEIWDLRYTKAWDPAMGNNRYEKEPWDDVILQPILHIKTPHLLDEIPSSFVVTMKFTTAFAIFVTLATAVSGAPQPLTNAKRLAIGLNPNPPVRREPTNVFGMWMFILETLSFFIRCR